MESPKKVRRRPARSGHVCYVGMSVVYTGGTPYRLKKFDFSELGRQERVSSENGRD